MAVSIESIKDAHERIKKYVHKTPVLESRSLNKTFGIQFFFKCENFQKTGSFKIRGATNAVFSLSESEIEKGVITHSSGNHGAALAQAALWRNTKSYVVTPRLSPEVKKKALTRYAAEITYSDVTLTSRIAETEKIIEQTGAVFIHPYDNDVVISGAATVSKELIESVSDLDFIMAPVGGGGLISGTSIAAKALLPGVKVIGSEPELADDAFQSFNSGILHPQKPAKTIADGLRTALCERTFRYISEKLDDIVVVSEQEIIDATRMVWQQLKIIIELSSAVPFAAAIKMGHKLKGKRVGIIFSGGNADLKYTTGLF